MKKILFIFVAALAFSACSDSYLDTINKNTLDMGSFYKTENDLLLATNAAYTPLAYGIADSYNRRGMFGGEYMLKMNVLDPYMWFESPNAGLDQLAITTSDFEGYYNALYVGLYRTSDILAKMHSVQSVMDSTKYNQYKGQLQALRGMYYFYLVTWFNKPVFYDETDVPSDPLAVNANGTPEQFWNKLEEDLNSAAKYLPTSWPDAELGRITCGAAYAQLGKALLYKHYHYYLRFGKGNTPEAITNLQKAKDALKHVIDSKVYHLILPVNKTKEDYQAALLSNSSYLPVPPMNADGVITNTYTYPAENNAESIWEIQYNDDDRNATGWLPGEMWGGNLNYLFSSPHLGSYKNLEIDPTLWYEFETVSSHPAGYNRDPRAYATCYLDGDLMDWRPESKYKIGFQSGLNSKNTVFNNNLYKGDVPSKSIVAKKYAYPQFVTKDAPNCAPFNVRVIRYADVLLMYAEVCYQLDADADGSGLAALNEVRSRVDMPAIAALTPAAIVHERTVELATEGIHYNDIVRWMWDPNFGIDLVKLFNGKFNKDKNFCFPIPQGAIDANKGALKQNPGW
ncbi:MAG: RagB/SusD family nutrient uptake outer membrane protein [Bacteroidota bacterium]|nr:RagB/SusD family nutrient uptake outer membrane protein [Bacteroidota bacterium]